MNLVASYYGDATQVALALASTILMTISIRAYRTRREGRYLVLMLAFVFFCAASISNMALALFAGLGAGLAPFFEVYVIPSLELMMVVSLLVALAWSSKASERRLGTVFIVVILSIGIFAWAAYSAGSGDRAKSPLPAGCVRQTGGFLIIASSLGYNDSIAHGAPVKSWPVMDVTKGTDVNITLCNTYSQTIGFQVAHYLSEKIDTVLPGQVASVSFLANQTGTFTIYCTVFNPIHIYLQGGELNVV